MVYTTDRCAQDATIDTADGFHLLIPKLLKRGTVYGAYIHPSEYVDIVGTENLLSLSLRYTQGNLTYARPTTTGELQPKVSKNCLCRT